MRQTQAGFQLRFKNTEKDQFSSLRYWYSCAVAGALPFESTPPITSTFPSLGSVAVRHKRGAVILPVSAKDPAVGSKQFCCCEDMVESTRHEHFSIVQKCYRVEGARGLHAAGGRFPL
jgi:hypothetical protein